MITRIGSKVVELVAAQLGVDPAEIAEVGLNLSADGVPFIAAYRAGLEPLGIVDVTLTNVWRPSAVAS